MHDIKGCNTEAISNGWWLGSATPASWAARMAPHVGELLCEQAHLEKKAAAGALGFLFRVPAEPGIQTALSRIAREELVHFERVLRLLTARDLPFGPLRPSPYAERLKRVVSSDMPDRLLDDLLVSAVIEARSCERMELLAEAVAGIDPEVSRLYRELVAAEQRHRLDYLEIALRIFPPEAVTGRWRAVSAHECSVLAGLPWQPRLHSGTGQDRTDEGAAP